MVLLYSHSQKSLQDNFIFIFIHSIQTFSIEECPRNRLIYLSKFTAFAFSHRKSSKTTILFAISYTDHFPKEIKGQFNKHRTGQ